MAEILTAYLAQVSKTPFSYDGADCGAFAFGWADCVTGIDGLSRWRGQYRTESECNLAIELFGGMQSWALRFLFETYGLAPTMMRAPGNIVLANFGGMKTMAIRVSEKLIALRSNGVHVTSRAKPITEWGFPCRQS